MSTPNSNNIALIHTHLYVYIAQFRAYFLRNQPFSNPKPIFLCLRFQRESPVEDMLFEKGVLLNVNDKFKQYCTKSRGLVCIYRTTSRIFFTKSTVFRVQTPHFYVYCFNESAYPYVEIPTVMSV